MINLTDYLQDKLANIFMVFRATKGKMKMKKHITEQRSIMLYTDKVCFLVMNSSFLLSSQDYGVDNKKKKKRKGKIHKKWANNDVKVDEKQGLILFIYWQAATTTNTFAVFY